MDNLHVELAAHEASSNTFKYVAQHLGIVCLENHDNDECLAVWFYRQCHENDVDELKRISCKSHNLAGAIIGVLRGIQDLTKCSRLKIKLVGVEEAKSLLEDLFGK